MLQNSTISVDYLHFLRFLLCLKIVLNHTKMCTLLVMMRIRILLAVLLLPPSDVLQLAFFATREVLGILGLLQRMPVVEDPVGRNDLPFERTAAGAVGDCAARAQQLFES